MMGFIKIIAYFKHPFSQAYFSEALFQPIDFSRMENKYLVGKCVVEKPLSSTGEYRVKVGGSSWNAQSHNWHLLKTSQLVCVIGRKGLTLLVEPMEQSYKFRSIICSTQ